MCMCTCLFINMNIICMQCPWLSKEGTDPLELEIQVIVSHLLWVLGSEAGSTESSSRALNLGEITSVPGFPRNTINSSGISYITLWLEHFAFLPSPLKSNHNFQT